MNYRVISQLGIEGKDGNVYIVENRNGTRYAKKVFHQSKSEDEIVNECVLQKIASDNGISPSVIEINSIDKYLVMDLMGETLFDSLKRKNGKISDIDQKRIIYIFDVLDKLGIYHGDPSPLNFVYGKDKKLYIIDFGFGVKYPSPCKYKSTMIVAFLLQLKKLGLDTKQYVQLRNELN